MKRIFLTLLCTLTLWALIAWRVLAFAVVGTTGIFSSSKTAGTSFSMSTSENLTAGNLLVVMVGMDNTSSGTDGDNNDISSVDIINGSSVVQETLTEGLTWANVQTGAGTGATIGIYYKVLSGSYSSGTVSIRANFAGSVTAKALASRQFTKGAGTSIGFIGQGGSVDGGTSTTTALSGLTSRAYLCVYGFASESVTNSANTTGWDGGFVGGTPATSGGGGASNMSLSGVYKLATVTSLNYTNSFTSADIADAVGVFYEFTARPRRLNYIQ